MITGRPATPSLFCRRDHHRAVAREARRGDHHAHLGPPRAIHAAIAEVVLTDPNELRSTAGPGGFLGEMKSSAVHRLWSHCDAAYRPISIPSR
jgi:hypothetical protein